MLARYINGIDARKFLMGRDMYVFEGLSYCVVVKVTTNYGNKCRHEKTAVREWYVVLIGIISFIQGCEDISVKSIIGLAFAKECTLTISLLRANLGQNQGRHRPC